MKSKEIKVFEETTRYFPRDWEEFYHDSQKIKAIKLEMDGLVEKLLTAGVLAETDGSMARAAGGIRAELKNKQHQLIDAISEERKTRKDAEDKRLAKAAEEKRLALATDANEIAKNAQILSKRSMWITVVLGICTILLQLYLNLTKEERIKEQILEESKKTTSPLVENLQKLQNEISEKDQNINALTEKVDQLQKQVAESKKAQPSSVKKKKSQPTSKKSKH